jgi:hypothetical protein
VDGSDVQQRGEPSSCNPNWKLFSEDSSLGSYRSKSIVGLKTETTVSLYGKVKLGQGILTSEGIEGEWCPGQDRYRTRKSFVGTNQDGDFEAYAAAYDGEIRIGVGTRGVSGRLSTPLRLGDVNVGSFARQIDVRSDGVSLEVTITLAPDLKLHKEFPEVTANAGVRLRLRTDIYVGEGSGLLMDDIRSGESSRKVSADLWQEIGYPLNRTLRIPIP